MVTKLEKGTTNAVSFVSSAKQKASRGDTNSERETPRSPQWLDLFCAMSYNQLAAWVEGHDQKDHGYLEATHVLWCRTCIDDVMAGKLSPKEVPMFENLADYFAQ